MNNSVWPYEELTIQVTTEGRCVFATPWFSRQIQLLPEFREEFMQFFERPSDYPVTSQVQYWSQLFGESLGDPLFYILPRATSLNAQTDVHVVKDGSARLRELQNQFVKNETNLSDDIKKNLLLRDWDAEALLGLSQIPGTEQYDPISLFSAMRRFYYLDALHFDQTIAMYEEVREFKKTSDEKFRKAMAVVSRQNYEVTHRCQEVLAPALELAQSARAALTEFMQAEKGHDNLLRRGLQELDANVIHQPALPVTTHLLDVFKTNAQSNFLAFALTVSLFEETSPDGGTDPLTRTLLENGEEKAAEAFLRHGQINDEGGHENMGVVFLQNMAPIDKAYALEAIEMGEAVSKVINVYTTQIRDEIRRK